MPPSYTANNALPVDASHSGTLTLATPAVYNALSLLGSAAYGPITIAYTVNHANSSTETGTIALPDWFSSQTAATGKNA